jgi:hypothetical protein
MMMFRVAEVGWGVAVAIAIVWVVTWVEGRISRARSSQSTQARG